MSSRVLIGIFCGLFLLGREFALCAAEPDAAGIFARKNLVAWCIVPFDSKKRGPEERAAMLEKLGFSKFAYDYRPEHIPTFDAEIEALKRHGIELTAWWFPASLNDEAKKTLEVFERHKVTPQLWVTGGGAPTKSEEEQRKRVVDEAARIRPIAEAAAKVGCKVALYNHGGWFGEPENQIAIIQELKLDNVGIVYNLHHGHDHLARFPELVKAMKPYLYAFNLNGMVKDGEKRGQKILQLGEGDLDLRIMQIVKGSGYSGLIGILGHTSDDAEERLQDNLDGLDWLLPQLSGRPAGPKPKMRTPVPVSQVPVAAAVPAPNANLPRLVEGKFGMGLDGKAGGAFVPGRDEFHEFPITVECWTKITDKGPYNILIANEMKVSGTHWELFTMAGTGNLTVYAPGFAPDHCHSNAMVCDGKWHHLAMVLELERIRLFVDGKPVASQAVKRTDMKSVSGDFAISSLVERVFGSTGVIDDVRVSRGIRPIDVIPSKPYESDESTIALWNFDKLVQRIRLEDTTGRNDAIIGSISPVKNATVSKVEKIDGHWGEEALGFRWTEQDSRDDRFGQMDTGPFFSGSITGAGGIVYKGIVVRVGADRANSICYDTEQMRASAGWKGFVRFDPARFGIIVPPRIDGEVAFTTPILAGWSRTAEFTDRRKTQKYGPLPKTEAHYEGLFRHGQRVVLKFTVGSQDPVVAANQTPTVIFESPWIEEGNGITALSRTIRVEPSTTPLSMLVADQRAHVQLVSAPNVAELKEGPQHSHVLFVPAHAEPVTVKLLIGSPAVDDAAFGKLASDSPAPEDLLALTKPGPSIWGEPLVTTGELGSDTEAYTIDTINLPFENRFKALMFLGGHDFLPDGRAYISTLHGDVWLVDGIDEQLKRVTWRRYATGLFQPLGVKIRPAIRPNSSGRAELELFVVGRDQITRLHDLNGDGEADFYENFNNDAYVSLNGHEYVTCLETDRAGNFYFVKGNCESATPHDGSLLRVPPDGSRVEVFATGFRNSNGIGIGPHDEITVAPQEGEWTPGSAVFDVHQGGFYGMMASHHRPTPPTDFERPFCWFPRLADNSCGGQVWVTSDRWGPLAGHLLHLSYGKSRMRLMLREELTGREISAERHEPNVTSANSELKTAEPMNGGSTDFGLEFASGVHRGRFNQKDGQLYLTGLKGWVTNAVNDGCFQRVRYTGRKPHMPVEMKTYGNGITLTFSDSLESADVQDVDNYEIEAWNYRWSAEYGSPEFKPSMPGQPGRDVMEVTSATLLPDRQTVFLEIPNLIPVDQLGVGITLKTSDGKPREQISYLTLNKIPREHYPTDQLHRPTQNSEKAELIARLKPGVMQTSSGHTGSTWGHQIAWYIEDSNDRKNWFHPDDGKKSPDSTSSAWSAQGYLRVPFSADFRFSTADDADATLEIDGKKRKLSRTEAIISLRKGYHKLEVTQHVRDDDEGLRLMWQSERIPRELVPPSALFHNPAEDLASSIGGSKTLEAYQNSRHEIDGKALFQQHLCGNCHLKEGNQQFPRDRGVGLEGLRQAPSLEGIGSRVTSKWLSSWLRDPSQVRSQATMPRLLHVNDDASLRDLVAYLSSIRVIGQESSSPATTDAGDIQTRAEKGKGLFEQLGCIACHTFAATDPTPAWDRISLAFVKDKYQVGQLEKYLRAPHRFHNGSHMPDFRLSNDEVGFLTAFLEQSSQGTVPQIENSNSGTGNAERGEKRFKELRCNRCHQVSMDDKLAASDIRIPAATTRIAGCLVSSDNPKDPSPRYRFSDDERHALDSYLKTATDKNTGSEPLMLADVQLHRVMKSLRCTACHSKDTSTAILPEIVSEEGSGKLPETIPQLTWTGEKLQGPWIAKLLKGELPQKPRPWLVARMPSFPAYADAISHVMASEHGLPYHEPVPTELIPEQVEIGRQLTLRDGGLDCRQCHGVGSEQPKGDKATQIALGINFTLVRERLRPEFALRQMLDPPRYDIGSRMPRFAPDLQTTAVKKVERGNAKKQFEAIKQYLWSLKSD